MRKLILLLFLAMPAAMPAFTWAGAQQYEVLSASVQAALSKSISDQAAPADDALLAFDSVDAGRAWLAAMSSRLAPYMADAKEREDFLVTVNYEAKRAGLDPQLVLGLIQVESRFHKYAISRAGARGYMQVMPFWVQQIGAPNQNLFHLRTNLRYGCTILRYYLDMENGDYFRALGRYNGSLGASDYPTRVVRAWQTNWKYPAK